MPPSGRHRERKTQKITVFPPGMVFESTTEFPTPEGAERRCLRPATYGFRSCDGVLRSVALTSSTGLPYTIGAALQLRGHRREAAISDREIMSGNVRLAMSHVVPDLVQKVLKGQDPLHILGEGKPGPSLHLRRRPGARHPAVHRASARP